MKLRTVSVLVLLAMVPASVAPFAAQEATEEPFTETDGQSFFPPVEGFPAFVPSPTMVEVIEDRGDTLLVRHLYGETEVPKSPQRIFADQSTMEILLSIDAPVVAVSSIYGTVLPMPPLLEPKLAGVTEYQFLNNQLNLENVLTERPDLIVVWRTALDEDLYEQLSLIAPTVVLMENSYTFWQQATVDLATMLGVPQRSETALADYERLIAAGCERIRSVIGDGETLTVLNNGPDGVSLFGPGYTVDRGYIPFTPGGIYWLCGVAAGVEAREMLGTDRSALHLSKELLSELQADHIMIMGIGSREEFDTLTDDPLWRTLPAVRDGQVYWGPYTAASNYYLAVDMLDMWADAIAGEHE